MQKKTYKNVCFPQLYDMTHSIEKSTGILASAQAGV